MLFLRKENERIQQVEGRNLTQEFEKRSFSHRYCFTPNNSQQCKVDYLISITGLNKGLHQESKKHSGKR